MKDIFTGDIFEKIEPPHDVSFKIVGTALPTNQDMYFVAKWHEIFERYTSARLFVRKALEDNWDYWFNKMEDEKVQCAIEYKFKAEAIETERSDGMPYFNIVAETNENTVVTEYEPVKKRCVRKFWIRVNMSTRASRICPIQHGLFLRR